MRIVLQDTRLEPFARVCKSNSVSECYVTLLYSLLHYCVLDQSQLWQMMHMLWQMPMFGNPGLVESPIFLHLLHAMVHRSKYDTPLLLTIGEGIHSESHDLAPKVHAESSLAFSQPDTSVVDNSERLSANFDSYSHSHVFDILRGRFGGTVR